MLVGYVAMVPTILIWEKYSGSKSGIAFGDERLKERKSEIDKLQKRIDKSRSQSEKKFLQFQKKTLEDELRRLEWTIRESKLSRIRDPAKDDDHPKLGDSRVFRSPTSVPKIESGSERTKEFGLRNFDPNDLQKREHLLRILGDAKQVLTKESSQTICIELLYLANEVRAHYNIIRKKDPSLNSLLSDYWVVWVGLYSLSNNSPLPSDLDRYASASFRSKFISFTKFTNSQRLSVS